MNIPNQLIIVFAVIAVLTIAIFIIKMLEGKSDENAKIESSKIFKPSEYSKEFKKANNDSKNKM